MSNSKGSPVVVGHERTQRSLCAIGVVPYGSGQGQETLQNPSEDATRCSSPVTLEVELRLECGVDRFDDLAHGLEERTGGSATLAFGGRAHQCGAVRGDEVLELARGVALVGQDHLAGAQQARFALE